MSAIDDLRASDTLQFDSISYQRHVSTRGVPDVDVTIPGFCVTKSGALALELDPATLFGLPMSLPPFRFTGTPNGNQVTWHIDQPLDFWYAGAHLSRVHGQIVTLADSVTPSLGTDCRGALRVQTVTLTTVGTANAVSIDTDPDVGSATIRNISAQMIRCGEAPPPVFFFVSFSVNGSAHDDCGHSFQIEGSTVRVTALVEDLHAVGAVTNITYSWTPPPAGVHVNGPTDQASIEVLLNSTGLIGLTCQVVVTTTVESGTNQSTANLTVLAADDAALRVLGCQLIKLDRRLPPLLFPGDPALPRVATLHELYMLRASAERIAEAASSLATQATSVIEHRESMIR